MKTLTNVSEIYAAGGGEPLARSNPAVTTVTETRVTPYVRPECCGCRRAECCGPCGRLLAVLCLCGCARGGCGRPCGGCPCVGCCRPFVVTAFYGRGCGCRGYSTYYPHY